MRKILRTSLVACACTLLAPALLAQDAKPAAAKPAHKMKPAAAAKLVTMTPDELKWMPNPGAPEVKMAAAWGDPSKGAHGAFHKFPAGFAAPLHTHSADMKLVVISGTLIGSKETKLPPGSYVYQPHTVKHVTKCDAGSECVIYATANKAFDLIPAEAKK